MRHYLQLIVMFVFCLQLGACADQVARDAQKHYLQARQYYAAHDFSSAFIETSRAARGGNLDAEYALGYMYYYGQGTPQDMQTGLTWIKRAAILGQPDAIAAMKMLKQPPFHISVAAPITSTSPALKIATPATIEKPNAYTLQLFEAPTLKALEHFVKENHLSKAQVNYSSRIVNGEITFILTYGHYLNYSAAERALKKLPKALKKYNPWVKPLTDVHP